MTAATKKHRERWERLRQHGCVACKKVNVTRHAEIHHLVGGYRLGHDATIPLCAWHHRGVPVDINWTKTQSEQWLGPSLAENKKQFVERFGSEVELLEEINSWLDLSHTPDGGTKATGGNGNFSPY